MTKSLQVTQNQVARVVTRLDWSTSTSVLLKQCGWLSVNQLMFYHSVLLVYKVQAAKSPKYLYEMHNTTNYQYRTRHSEQGLIKPIGKPRLDLNMSSFRWRAANQYNQLPLEIRNASSLLTFKFDVKNWIRNNISIN